MKKALLAGLVSFGCATLISAQVTSINAVGYANLTVPPGFSMIANQLNTANNTIGSLIPTPPVGTRVFKWNGTQFTIFDYTTNPFTQQNGWSPNGSATLNPGEGAFIFNPSGGNITLTFVGEVPTGTASNTSVPSGFSIVASAVPQSALLQTTLGFPMSAGDRVFRWNGTGYSIHDYTLNPFTQQLAWSPSEPTPAVGESFFSFKGNSASWNRNFSIQ
jgi:hypothetical protein